MGLQRLIVPTGSIVNKRKFPIIVVIAICWTIADFLIFLVQISSDTFDFKYDEPRSGTFRAILLRELNVLLVSLLIGFLLVSVLRRFFRHASMAVNLIAKTVILIAAGLIMSFLIYMTYEMIIGHRTFIDSIHRFLKNTFKGSWIVPKMAEWTILYLLTQLALEVNEKYSPGAFFDIILGKYLKPREEERIIVFIDLRNSTPIAEKIGANYFEFIRDFIFCISAGIMEHEGRIYQYVGDEIVAWWPSSGVNAKKAVQALIESRKILNINNDIFKSNYDIVPEYKAGMHTGKVTVGQVGIARKELVMSGDTINTASRIRGASTDLNQKFLVSKEIIDLLQMKDWQTESMGNVDLKGKNENIELFALKI
jgi:adenylate cyclase